MTTDFVPRKRMTGTSRKAVVPVQKSKPKLKYNHEIDKKNQETFNKYFVKELTKERYNCVVCGKAISLVNSISDKGKVLICKDCNKENK